MCIMCFLDSRYCSNTGQLRFSVKHFISPTSGLTLCTRCIPFISGVERKNNSVGSTAYGAPTDWAEMRVHPWHRIYYYNTAEEKRGTQLQRISCPLPPLQKPGVPVKPCPTKASQHGLHRISA